MDLPYGENLEMMDGNLRLASPWQRLQAYLLDVALVYVPVLSTIGVRSSIDPSDSLPLGEVLIAVASVMTLVLALANLALYLRTGQSWGKRCCGLVIRDAFGQPVSGWGLLGRGFSQWLLTSIPLVNLCNLLFIFSSSRRCLHDHLAGTFVAIQGPPIPRPLEVGFSRF